MCHVNRQPAAHGGGAAPLSWQIRIDGRDPDRSGGGAVRDPGVGRTRPTERQAISAGEVLQGLPGPLRGER